MRLDFSDTVTTVSPEDIEGVPDPSPTFWIWVWSTFIEGTLGFYVTAVIQSGNAEDTKSALGYLNGYCAENGDILPHVTVGDLERGRRNDRFTELARLITGQPKASGNRVLLAGSVGHQQVGDLMSGRFVREHHMSRPALPFQQGHLFEESEDIQTITQVDSPSRCGVDPIRLLASIDRQWQRIAVACGPIRSMNVLGPCDWEAWRAYRGKILRLRASLDRLCPDAIRQLTERCGETLNDTTALSILSWAAAVSAYRQGGRKRDRVLFREIAVTDFGHHLNGGRIDALEVRQINGRVPNSRQLEQLRILSTQRYRSVGQLFGHLQRVFSDASLQIAIIDWKFLVGDVLTSSVTGTAPDVTASPLPSHVKQIERYLTLSLLDFHLAQGGASEIWSPDRLRLSGELWYILPHCHPVVHAIMLEPDATRQKFVELIVQKWPVVTERAVLRQITTAVSRHLLAELTSRPRTSNGNNHASGNGRAIASANANIQTDLFADQPSAPTVQSIIAAHEDGCNEEVAGTFGVIRKVGTDNRGRPTHEMHLDQLIQAIARNQINTYSFDPEDGGKICCPFPDHQERTPSMQVYISQGSPRFFCYGCNRFGRINPRSIPPNVVVACAGLWKQRREHVRRAIRSGVRFRDVQPTEEHQLIMDTAQLLLSRAFPGSPGERYVREVRRLDPSLVHEMKGGYADASLIDGLLEAGFSYDQLVYYGFIRLSQKVKPTWSLVKQLVGHGIPVEKLYRPCGPCGQKSKTLGLPYSALHGRITVPLGLPDRGYDNFYGRSLDPNAGKIDRHRKLTKDHTRVLHGGYNMAGPLGSGKEVIVTEGVMDAWTLIQIGHQHTMAMVGVANAAIADTLAKAGRNIAAGLDTDATGVKKTGLLNEALTVLGFRGGFRNFTIEFFAQRPGEYKDFNQWWQECGHHQ